MTSQNHLQLDGAEFLSDQTRGLSEPSGSPNLAASAKRSSKHNRAVTDAVPYFQDWRLSAHRIKTYAIANLDKLLVEFEQKLIARDIAVLWAKDATEANRQVLDIARRHSVKRVVKAKSMVSEELNLNHVLESANIRSLETDLGEYIVQLAGQRPSHLVAPALHLSAGDVGRLFSEKLGETYTEEHQALTQIARRRLREEYLAADMGISGCNFAVVDTGTIVVVENEGNAGLSTVTPPVHIALIGIEKMLPSIEYLPLFLNLLVRSCTGQKLTSYTHLIHGATSGKKLYVILLDNGRSDVLKDPKAWASLHCIRCGACMNTCPVYHQVGGWAYGWVYPGPIGSILTPHLMGLKKAGKLPFASSLCGACAEVCPVKIDIPHQLVHLRHRAVREISPMNSWTERLMWIIWAWFMGGRIRYKLLMTGIRLGVRLARFLPWHPGKLGAWTRGRTLPPIPGPDFRSTWKKVEGENTTPR